MLCEKRFFSHSIQGHMHTFRIAFTGGKMYCCPFHWVKTQQLYFTDKLIFSITDWIMWTGCIRSNRRQPSWLKSRLPSILDECYHFSRALNTRTDSSVCACLANSPVQQQEPPCSLNVPSAIHSRCNLGPKAPLCTHPLTWPQNRQFLGSPHARKDGWMRARLKNRAAVWGWRNTASKGGRASKCLFNNTVE